MPRTRSQSSQECAEHQCEDSSDSERLNDTIVNNDANKGATENGTDMPPTPAIPSAESIVTSELLSSLMSTITSLKSAIDDLRHDSCRRSNMPQYSVPSQNVAQMTHTDGGMPVPNAQFQSVSNISCHEQVPSASSNLQSMPPLVYRQQVLPRIVQQIPALTRGYMPMQELNPNNGLPDLRNSQESQQTRVNMQQMRTPTGYAQQGLPLFTDTVQAESLSGVRQLPPTTGNLQQQAPSTNFNFRSPSYGTNFYTARPPTTTQSTEFISKLYHLPNFDGKPEDWPLFLASYEDTTGEFGYTNRQNLIRLQKALQGAARNSVMSMLIYPENVPQIIDELRFNFGRPELLVKSQLDKIKMYPVISENRLEGILGLSSCAKNIVAFFKSAKCENYLMNPTLLEQLVLKLPLSKQYEWAKFSASVSQFPTVEHFAEWISDLARYCSLMPQRGPALVNDRQQNATATRRVLHTKEDQSRQNKCQQCKGGHEIAECEKFKELSTSAKWEQVKRLHVCFSCLRKGHSLVQCRKRKICGINDCSRYHHPTLHQDISGLSIADNNNKGDHVLQCRQNESASSLFKILPVALHGPNGTVTVYALLDEGSSISLIEENFARSLGLKGQKSSITLQWYDDMRKTEASMRVNVDISPVNDRCKKYAIRNLQTVRKLNLPSQSFDRMKFGYLSHLPIESYEDKKPTMLIGLDNCMLGLAKQVVEAGPHLPVASDTKLGWVAYGPLVKKSDNTSRICHINECNVWKELHQLVQDYFSIENFGVKATNFVLESEDNKRARNILENTCRKIEGHYETGLLWKKDDVALPDSFEMAKNRLLKTENKMKRDPIYAVSYRKEMEKYISKGYARKLSPLEVKTFDRGRVWYLPHFGVVNPHKPGKLRIVFDAAAMTSNVSLNSVLLKGPEQARPLQTIMFQFRQGRIAVAGDIQEMFSQVFIRDYDQNLQRFLWRENEVDDDVSMYVMKSMIFGSVCSPCCAEYVKNRNAKEFESTWPRGAETGINHMYVDDLVVSFNSFEEALEVTQEAIQINAAAGFKLRNFSSNSRKLQCLLNGGEDCSSTMLRMEKQNDTDKILGLYWNKQFDTFKFHIKFHKICADVLEGKRTPTKREVLGIVMAVFDPFGFLANFTIFSKLFIQRTWKLGLQWDDQLPEQILTQWHAWWREFDKVKQLSIPRCYSELLSVADEIQLHIFVDASSSAFAAVAYFRVKRHDSIHTSFVMAKARCAPSRGMTIPRLELQAAVLGCRLKVLIEESHNLKIHRVVLWSDSKTVLFWIKSTEREYKQFVACRISEILSATEPEQWKWLPTDLNVADEATRAKLPISFGNDTRWLKGPEFLALEEQFWPGKASIFKTNESQDEEKFDVVLKVSTVDEPIFRHDRFSNFLKLKRCAAWVLRFVDIKARKIVRASTELTVGEIEAGEKLICRQVQMEAFGAERLCIMKGKPMPKSFSIYQLTPYMDNDMLLRVNGRIDNAYFLPETARNPIIMPTKHLVTFIIVDYYHRENQHQNDNATINGVRQKFWVPYIRSVLRSVKKLCSFCILHRAKPAPPLMGQLPSDRITPYVRPFSYVGLDYCGPFYVTIGRRREKRWIALFTCLVTRALHLEVAVDLSTDAFLLCLRNFVNRRGAPIRIRSDNGTNFIGARKEILNENRFFDHDEIQKNISKDNIEWIFNCPANPHAGGCWERLVKCVKQLLYRILKEEAPRLETFRSAIIEAECIVNNRPLTQLPIDPGSEEPLTPNHFLIGSLNSTQTPGPNDENLCLRKQWRIAQNLKDRLWKRWVVEYLPQLLQRPKWREKVTPLQVGDAVLILDPHLPRSQWKLGKVSRRFIHQTAYCAALP